MYKLVHEMFSRENPEKAQISQGFFKTGKGEYGEGDLFLGLTVPQTRGLVKKFAPEMTLEDVDTLLADKHHEVRLAGVLILVYFAQKKKYPLKKLAEFYLKNAGFNPENLKQVFRGATVGASGIQKSDERTEERVLAPLNSFGTFGNKSTKNNMYFGINNWDLIDTSSEHIIGPYIQHELTHEERVDFITQCIASSNLWINRIIVLASFHQIKQSNGKLTIYIAERMLTHKHDLIHKAVGWMLREVGKRCSMEELRGFLDQYAPKMPRTMLRYAIEKMNETERKKYLSMKA